MPKHWQETTLGEACALEIGRTPPRNRPDYWTTSLERPFCTIADLDRRIIAPGREGVTDSAERDQKARRVEAGSLLMSFKLTIGRVAFAGCDLFPNEAIVVITPDESLTSREYLYLNLGSRDLTDGSGQAVKGKTLNSKSLRAIPLDLPPLEEQRRIVDLVGSIDAYIDCLETQIDTTRTARSALLSELLSNPGEDWQETTLGVHASVRTGSLDVNASVKGGRYPFFTCAREVYEIDTAAFSGPSTLVAGNGDFNVKYFDGEFNAYQRTYVIQSIRPTSLAHRYLNLILEVAIENIRLDSRGTTIKYLKKGQFTDYSFALPPISDQKMIVDLVGSFDEQILSLESQVESVRALRTGVLSELLAGECLLDDSYDMAVGL